MFFLFPNFIQNCFASFASCRWFPPVIYPMTFRLNFFVNLECPFFVVFFFFFWFCWSDPKSFESPFFSQIYFSRLFQTFVLFCFGLFITCFSSFSTIVCYPRFFICPSCLTSHPCFVFLIIFLWGKPILT